MIYIYDLIVNFNNKLYNFYDWNEVDCLEHIRKIPVVKVSDNKIIDIINNNVQINEKLLNLIYNKTEMFNEKILEKIKYCCGIGSNNMFIVIKMDDNGNVIKRSSLLLDEELEVIDIISSLKYYNIEYIIKDKINYTNILREDEKNINKILNYLKELKNNNKEELLEYLYYEWYCKKITNNKYYNKLIKDIKKEYTEKHVKYLKLLNLVCNK